MSGVSVQLRVSSPLTGTNGQIAFVINRDGNREIYLMNADGTGQIRLPTNTVSDLYPTWSPDGRRQRTAANH